MQSILCLAPRCPSGSLISYKREEHQFCGALLTERTVCGMPSPSLVYRVHLGVWYLVSGKMLSGQASPLYPPTTVYRAHLGAITNLTSHTRQIQPKWIEVKHSLETGSDPCY